MAIDKFVPRQLNTDVDQRYLQEGEMIDAINISFNEDGPNSQVVLKNERGTQTSLVCHWLWSLKSGISQFLY